MLVFTNYWILTGVVIKYFCFLRDWRTTARKTSLLSATPCASLDTLQNTWRHILLLTSWEFQKLEILYSFIRDGTYSAQIPLYRTGRQAVERHESSIWGFEFLWEMKQNSALDKYLEGIPNVCTLKILRTVYSNLWLYG